MSSLTACVVGVCPNMSVSLEMEPCLGHWIKWCKHTQKDLWSSLGEKRNSLACRPYHSHQNMWSPCYHLQGSLYLGLPFYYHSHPSVGSIEIRISRRIYTKSSDTGTLKLGRGFLERPLMLTLMLTDLLLTYASCLSRRGLHDNGMRRSETAQYPCTLYVSISKYSVDLLPPTGTPLCFDDLS